MHLDTWAEISLLIFGGLFSLITVALFGAIAFALNKLVSLLATVTDKLDPLIGKASNAVDTVTRVTTNVGAKADQVLVKGEALTDDVSGRVEQTAGVVQSAVIGPLINISSLINGVTKGFSVYARPGSGNGTKADVNEPFAKKYEKKTQ